MADEKDDSPLAKPHASALHARLKREFSDRFHPDFLARAAADMAAASGEAPASLREALSPAELNRFAACWRALTGGEGRIAA